MYFKTSGLISCLLLILSFVSVNGKFLYADRTWVNILHSQLLRSGFSAAIIFNFWSPSRFHFLLTNTILIYSKIFIKFSFTFFVACDYRISNESSNCTTRQSVKFFSFNLYWKKISSVHRKEHIWILMCDIDLT